MRAHLNKQTPGADAKVISLIFRVEAKRRKKEKDDVCLF
jgi:hypothetical protein